MSLYDYIAGKLRCPHCGAKTEVHDQIKWTLDPCLETIRPGDEIEAHPGVYEHATMVRPHMESPCSKCGVLIRFGAVVRGCRLDALFPITDSEEATT